MFILWAKLSKEAFGSAPLLRIKTRGVVSELSLKDFEISNTGGEMN